MLTLVSWIIWHRFSAMIGSEDMSSIFIYVSCPFSVWFHAVFRIWTPAELSPAACGGYPLWIRGNLSRLMWVEGPLASQLNKLEIAKATATHYVSPQMINYSVQYSDGSWMLLLICYLLCLNCKWLSYSGLLFSLIVLFLEMSPTYIQTEFNKIQQEMCNIHVNPLITPRT